MSNQLKFIVAAFRLLINKNLFIRLLLRTKLSFKEAYNLKVLPITIKKLEAQLLQSERLLSKKDLYKEDKEIFDKTINEISNIKEELSLAEDEWLKLQILYEEINFE